jgi:adenosylcobinamide-phosphate synthase
MSITLTVFLALLQDACPGESRRFHPLAGFGIGRLAGCIERHIDAGSRIQVCTALLLVTVPFTVLAACVNSLLWHFMLDALLLYLPISWNSLDIHAQKVKHALLANDLAAVRQQAGLIINHDTDQLGHVLTHIQHEFSRLTEHAL